MKVGAKSIYKDPRDIDRETDGVPGPLDMPGVMDLSQKDAREAILTKNKSVLSNGRKIDPKIMKLIGEASDERYAGTEIPEKLSKNIKKYRNLKNKSYETLAKEIGIESIETICTWEKGTKTPNLIYCFRLAKAFNISLDDLMSFDRWEDFSWDKEIDSLIEAMMENKKYIVKFLNENDTITMTNKSTKIILKRFDIRDK